MDARYLKNRLNAWLPISLIAIASAHFMLNAFLWNSSPNHWDSAQYLLDIRSISGGGGLEPLVLPLRYAHPAYILLSVFSNRLLSPLGLSVDDTTLLVSMLCGAFTSVAMYHIVVLIYSDRRLALWGAALTCFNPLVLWYSNEMMTDVPAFAAVMLSLVLSLKWRRDGGHGTLTAASLAFGVGLMFRLTNAIALPATLLVLLDRGGPFTQRVKVLTVFTALALVPLAAYVAYSSYALDATLGYYLASDPVLLPKWARFVSPIAWQILPSFVINIMTLFTTAVVVSWALRGAVSLIMGGGLPGDCTLKVAYPLALILPELVYTRSLLIWFEQHARYHLITVPGFVLILLYITHKVSRRLENSSVAFASILLVMSLSFAVDITLVLDVDYPKYDRLAEFIASNPVLFGTRLMAAFVFVAALYAAYINLTPLFRIKPAKVPFLLALLILYQVAYTFPILHLNHTSINHEKAEALWFAENTPPGSLILAGHEYPFDRYYAAPRKVVFVRNSSDLGKIRRAVDLCLGGNCSVYLTRNNYVRKSLILADKRYRLVKVGVIDGSTLRNQFEHEFYYMNYNRMSRAVNISFFRLESAPPSN